jgi:hypothetical protein
LFTGEKRLRRRLATNVRLLRARAGLTLEEAGYRAAMHWRHWQKIEAGEVNATLHTLVRVSAVLEVDPRDLLA